MLDTEHNFFLKPNVIKTATKIKSLLNNKNKLEKYFIAFKNIYIHYRICQYCQI